MKKISGVLTANLSNVKCDNPESEQFRYNLLE